MIQLPSILKAPVSTVSVSSNNLTADTAILPLLQLKQFSQLALHVSPTVIYWTSGGLIMLLMAIWSGIIANRYRHDFMLHFLLSILMPIAYPMVFIATMKYKDAYRKKHPPAPKSKPLPKAISLANHRRKRRINRPGVQEEEEFAEPDSAEMGKEHLTPSARMFKIFFEQLGPEANQDIQGLCIIYNDFEAYVEEIVELLPKAVVIKTTPRPSKPAVNLRIPYSRIQACYPSDEQYDQMLEEE